MSSPYREGPSLMLCPRCGEVLDRVFGGVSACPRCQGAWISQGTLDTAFGNARWPTGQNMWWHNALECPECACEGTITKMDARASDTVMVDLCPSHGLWLDPGELGRLMKLAEGSDELLELQKRVSAVSPDPDELAQRRLAWRTELDSRRRTATEFRSWVESEHKRKAAETAEAEKQAAIEEAAALRKARDAQAAYDKAAEASAAEHARQAVVFKEVRDELETERMEIVHRLRLYERQQKEHRDELVRLQGEIDQAQARLREIDRQLETK